MEKDDEVSFSQWQVMWVASFFLATLAWVLTDAWQLAAFALFSVVMAAYSWWMEE